MLGYEHLLTYFEVEDVADMFSRINLLCTSRQQMNPGIHFKENFAQFANISKIRLLLNHVH